jgi:hypothetical protein
MVSDRSLRHGPWYSNIWDQSEIAGFRTALGARYRSPAQAIWAG